MRTAFPVGLTGDTVAAMAESRVGGTYVLGAQVDKSAPGVTVFDCAELASWAVYRASGRLYGCSDNNGDPRTVDAYTGYWMRDALALGLAVAPEVAAGTPGAVLVRSPEPGAQGHAAVSDGRGGTHEAMGTAYGVVSASAVGRVWTVGVVVPWIAYRPGPPVDLRASQASSSIWPRRGDRGERVHALQRALARHGLDPGPPDGWYGLRTHAAVVLFQRFEGLPVDGLVGPMTRRALGL